RKFCSIVKYAFFFDPCAYFFQNSGISLMGVDKYRWFLNDHCCPPEENSGGSRSALLPEIGEYKSRCNCISGSLAAADIASSAHDPVIGKCFHKHFRYFKILCRTADKDNGR